MILPRKERIIEIETLRGMAFAAVVLQHSIAHYSLVPQAGLQDGVVMAVLLMLAKFAVPLFIFITGMVLFYNTGEQLNYSQFMRKRVMDVILPYVVWTLIYFILTPRSWTGFGWQELSDLGLKVVTGKTASHFWYIIMLIQIYVFFPLFLRGIRYIYQRYQAKGRMIALLISGIVYLILADQLSTIARWMEPLQIPVLTDAFTTYADRNFIYFFFLFCAWGRSGIVCPELEKMGSSSALGILAGVYCTGSAVYLSINAGVSEARWPSDQLLHRQPDQAGYDPVPARFNPGAVPVGRKASAANGAALAGMDWRHVVWRLSDAYAGASL